MDESEIRYLEAHLETEPKLPLSEQQLAALIRRAKSERAEAIAGMLSRLGAGIAAYFRALRESAAAQTGAGLRHR
ncbi:MAG: RSP_7527 family protein [Burkholderiales bacterium]